MTTYTITEEQRQQLLEMTAFAYNACEDDWVQDEKITPAISLLDGLTPNTSPVAEFVAGDGLGTVRFLAHEGEPLTDGQQLFATPRAAPSTSPYAWGVQGSSRMWFGEYAEIDAKSEAVRCNGTSHTAFPLYKGGA